MAQDIVAGRENSPLLSSEGMYHEGFAQIMADFDEKLGFQGKCLHEA